MPAAVQVSAASNITFSGDTFTHLGEVGLGIGQDSDAVASGVGLGASGVTVDHNTFTDDSGGGIVVGGVQTNAHHPSDPAMTDQNITLTNNLVSGVAEDYKDMAGILSTYVTHADIEHNEVTNLAYDGIDVGWGWGMNDAGGSQDYANRGTYNYQPRLHHADDAEEHRRQLQQGARHQEALPRRRQHLQPVRQPRRRRSTTTTSTTTSTPSASTSTRAPATLTLSNNVVQDTGVWAFTNANAQQQHQRQHLRVQLVQRRRHASRHRLAAQQPADRQRPGQRDQLALRRAAGHQPVRDLGRQHRRRWHGRAARGGRGQVP